jgi:hypothetical protein
MKSTAHLVLGLIATIAMTSCGLIQMPARLINTAIAPLTAHDETAGDAAVALEASRAAGAESGAAVAP